MEKDIQKEFESSLGGSITLAILPNSKYGEMERSILKLLLKKSKSYGAYLAINRPYASLTKVMEKNGIDTKKLLFLDCVTGRSSKVANCVFVRSAESLTNIGIALENVYKNKKISFIVIDSLDALSVYHSTNNILRFARSEIERMRENEKSAVILLSYDETDKK